jgi:hypothetical protein
MVGVAIVGIVLGLVVHVHALVREEDDFALPILLMEGCGMAILLAIASAVGWFVKLVQKDKAYAADLHRDDRPGQFRWTQAETESLAQE